MESIDDYFNIFGTSEPQRRQEAPVSRVQGSIKEYCDLFDFPPLAIDEKELSQLRNEVQQAWEDAITSTKIEKILNYAPLSQKIGEKYALAMKTMKKHTPTFYKILTSIGLPE